MQEPHRTLRSVFFKIQTSQFIKLLTELASALYLSFVGHRDWVTAIATSAESPDMILTSSRGT